MKVTGANSNIAHSLWLLENNKPLEKENNEVTNTTTLESNKPPEENSASSFEDVIRKIVDVAEGLKKDNPQKSENLRQLAEQAKQKRKKHEESHEVQKPVTTTASTTTTTTTSLSSINPSKRHPSHSTHLKASNENYPKQKEIEDSSFDSEIAALVSELQLFEHTSSQTQNLSEEKSSSLSPARELSRYSVEWETPNALNNSPNKTPEASPIQTSRYVEDLIKATVRDFSDIEAEKVSEDITRQLLEKAALEQKSMIPASEDFHSSIKSKKEKRKSITDSRKRGNSESIKGSHLKNNKLPEGENCTLEATHNPSPKITPNPSPSQTAETSPVKIPRYKDTLVAQLTKKISSEGSHLTHKTENLTIEPRKRGNSDSSKVSHHLISSEPQNKRRPPSDKKREEKSPSRLNLMANSNPSRKAPALILPPSAEKPISTSSSEKPSRSSSSQNSPRSSTSNSLKPVFSSSGNLQPVSSSSSNLQAVSSSPANLVPKSYSSPGLGLKKRISPRGGSITSTTPKSSASPSPRIPQPVYIEYGGCSLKKLIKDMGKREKEIGKDILKRKIGRDFKTSCHKEELNTHGIKAKPLSIRSIMPINSDEEITKTIEIIKKELNSSEVKAPSSMSIIPTEESDLKTTKTTKVVVETFNINEFKTKEKEALKEELKVPKLDVGIYSFKTSDKNFKDISITMNTFNPAFGILYKERVFSKAENTLMRAFVRVPDVEEIVGSSSSNLSFKKEYTVVLTEGKKANEKGEEVGKNIQKNIDGLIDELHPNPKSSFTLGDMLALQVKGIMEVNNSQNIGPTEVAVVNIVGGYVVVTTVGNIKTFILEHEDNRFQGFELKNMQSADSEEFIGVSKPVCPISGAEKLSTPRLVSSKSSEHLEDTHKASKRMIKMSSSIFQFEKGKHYQVVVCSKGAYDNLDPNIVGKEACQKTTTTTANNRSNYQENHTEKRSKWMTQKLCDIFNIPEVQSEEIPSLNILSKAFEHYNETMAMKINKKVLEGTTIEMHYRTHSSDEEKQDQQETCTITTTPPTPRDKIGEKWDSLFNSVGEGNPGFVAFAIFPYYQKESMVSKVNQDL